MSEDGRIEFDQIDEALEVIAEWLVACYGVRIRGLRLVLEGYYSGLPEYYGILPWIDRAGGETRISLPSREARDLAEGVFTDLLPGAQITRQGSRDVRDIARSSYIVASEVSAHRRIELLARFGQPSRSVPRP
mgnify:CR=1 FL=1